MGLAFQRGHKCATYATGLLEQKFELFFFALLADYDSY